MNDRYLFKAKRKNWKELPKEEWWVQGYYQKRTDIFGKEEHLIFIGESCRSWECAEIDLSTLCQCTGWKDKNKKLIFENDVVIYDKYKGIVRFGYYEWDVSEQIGFYIDWEKTNYRQDLGYWLDRISVIGSVFGNSELLKEAK